MKKFKFLVFVCFCFLVFANSFKGLKFTAALKKDATLKETKIKKNKNIENIQKITLNIPEKNPFIRGLAVVLTEENVLKNFLENLKITAELNEQKGSFFDVISEDADDLKNKDGIYISFAVYDKNFIEKEKAFEKTKKFLNDEFEKKLKKLNLNEKEIEQGLVKLGFFLNAQYQSTYSYFFNLKHKQKQILLNNLKNFRFILKNKDKVFKILELLDKELLVNLQNEIKNNKNWEETLIKNFKKEFLKNLEKEAKESFECSRKNLKDFLKFISGFENVEEIFKKYEKIGKSNSLNSNGLEHFFKNLFKHNKNRNQIIKDLKICIKNSKYCGLKQKQFKNRVLTKYEVINEFGSILNLLQKDDGYNKLEKLLKNEQIKNNFKKEINYNKNSNLNIFKTIFEKDSGKKQKIIAKNLKELRKIFVKLIGN